MRTDQANTCVRFMMCCLLYCKVLLLASGTVILFTQTGHELEKNLPPPRGEVGPLAPSTALPDIYNLPK